MLETVEAALTGPIGIAVATLAVIGTGFMCMMGRLNWGWFASVIIGIVEMVGRSILPFLMKEFISEDAAQTAGPAVASMLMYILMTLVLFFKPQGLFPAKTG